MSVAFIIPTPVTIFKGFFSRQPWHNNSNIITMPPTIYPKIRRTVFAKRLRLSQISRKAKNTTITVKKDKNAQSSKKSFNTIFRRLNTFQDKSSIHKSTGSVNLLSSIFLIGYGAMSHHSTGKWTLPPDIVFTPLLTIWLVSSVLNALSGLLMAVKYRYRTRALRDAFTATSVSVILSAWLAWWFSPAYPQLLSSQTVTNVVLGPQIVYCIYSAGTTLRDADDIIKLRQDKKAKLVFKNAKHSNFLWMRDFLVYVIPTTYQAVFYIIIAYMLRYDRETIIEMCRNIGDFQAMSVYLNIGFAFIASFASLCVTLRDRGLLSRAQEMSVISGMSWISAMIAISTISSYGWKALVFF